MSREIKFRAWDKRHEKYVELTGLDFGYGGKEILGIECLESGELRKHGINHFVLEQYTGLKDMNGKEIYEGDIVKDTEKDVLREIRWDELWATFTAIRIGRSLDTALYRSKERFVIVGNIRENPEFLIKKGGKNESNLQTDR